MDNMTVKATKKSFLEQTKKPKKYRKNPKTFFNPETDTDRKPTFEQKTDPDPDRLPKVLLFRRKGGGPPLFLTLFDRW
jgi:hypothetical protein